MNSHGKDWNFLNNKRKFYIGKLLENGETHKASGLMIPF